MAFATTAHLENRLRRSVNIAAAEDLLDEASSLVQVVCGQQILEVEDDEVTLVGNWTRKLCLPQWPVTAVTAVVLDGVELTDGDYTWQSVGVLWRPRYGSTVDNFPGLPGGYWGGPDRDVVVTYTHGLATIPTWVRSIVVDVCARAYASPDGVVREALDGYSATYTQTGFNQAGGVNLLASEEKKLRKLRKPGC